MKFFKIFIFSLLFNIKNLRTIQNGSFKPFVISNPIDHSMGSSLYGYLNLKIHELIRNKEFKKIIVIGKYDRKAEISIYEKKGKMFNWQRPTAEIKDETLYVKCFPGRNYVRHYASLISTYLAIHGRKFNHVEYLLPDESICWDTLTNSNLIDVAKGDVAILGYGLNILAEEDHKWNGNGTFSWVSKKVGNYNLVFIGCRHSFWGDIAGRIVSILAKKGFKKVIYVGKLGALRPNIIPNQTIATGSTSYINGKILHWENLFDSASIPEMIFGEHCHCPSILYETKEWLNKNLYTFVDPEIGHMAKAAASEDIQFCYIHLVSDNLKAKYTEDLSNEQTNNVKEKRLNLLKKIKLLIEQTFTK